MTDKSQFDQTYPGEPDVSTPEFILPSAGTLCGILAKGTPEDAFRFFKTFVTVQTLMAEKRRVDPYDFLYRAMECVHDDKAFYLNTAEFFRLIEGHEVTEPFCERIIESPPQAMATVIIGSCLSGSIPDALDRLATVGNPQRALEITLCYFVENGHVDQCSELYEALRQSNNKRHGTTLAWLEMDNSELVSMITPSSGLDFSSLDQSECGPLTL